MRLPHIQGGQMNRTGRLSAVLLLLATIAQARVISYSPYTDRASFPALQHRLNRHFVLVEQAAVGGGSGPIVSPPIPYYLPPGNVVIYDSRGLEEPRVVFPGDGSTPAISVAAAREEAGVVSILIQTSANFLGTNPTSQLIWLMSNDS